MSCIHVNQKFCGRYCKSKGKRTWITFSKIVQNMQFNFTLFFLEFTELYKNREAAQESYEYRM